MDPIVIASALGPIVLDLFRSLKDKFLPSGDYKPASIAEWVQMQQLELDRFKAMQDSGGDTGIPWANVLIRLQKPAYASLVVLVWAYQEAMLPGGANDTVVQFAQMIGFWLFGERIVSRQAKVTKP